jgi:hypothetical protein
MTLQRDAIAVKWRQQRSRQQKSGKRLNENAMRLQSAYDRNEAEKQLLVCALRKTRR